MPRIELLEPERAYAASRQMKEGRAAHRAESDDYHVVATLLSHRAISSLIRVTPRRGIRRIFYAGNSKSRH